MATRNFCKNRASDPSTGFVFNSIPDYLAYHLSLILISLSYGFILSSMPLTIFKDRFAYLRYAENSLDKLFQYWANSPLTGIVNEPLWLLINYVLSIFFTPENVLRVIIFIPATITALIVLQHGPKHFIWLLVFLLMPQVIKSHIIHLRQGLASTVFLMGWLSCKPTIRLTFIAITPFIHSAFFIVIMLLALSKIANHLRISVDLRATLFTIAGIFMGIGGLHWASEVLGARQAGIYSFEMKAASGLGFVFWFLVLLVMSLQGRDFIRRHTFELGTIIFYLSTFFFIEVATRIFKCTMIPLLLAGIYLTDWRRQVFFILIVFYGVSQHALDFYNSWSSYIP